MRTISRKDFERVLKFAIEKYDVLNDSKPINITWALGTKSRDIEKAYIAASLGEALGCFELLPLKEIQKKEKHPQRFVRLTNRGKVYFQMRRKDKKDFWRKDVLIPLATSALSYVSKYGEPGLFPRIQQSAQALFDALRTIIGH